MEDDDDLTLSTAAQTALAEFLAEKQGKEAEELDGQVEGSVSIDAFPEDWQLSQFWYDDDTAEKLAKELLEGATQDTVIAIISAPSVYAKIRNLPTPTQKIYLLEYDTRFSRLPPHPTYFIPYDFNHPLQLPRHLTKKVDILLADPPFLSDECLTKTAISARALLKTRGGRTMVCTGRKMEELVPRVFPGCRRREWEPRHRGGLSNAFGCFMDWEGRYV